MDTKKELELFLRHHVWADTVLKNKNGDPIAAVYYRMRTKTDPKEDHDLFIRHHTYADSITKNETGDPILAVYYPESWLAQMANQERAKEIEKDIKTGRSKFVLIMHHSDLEGHVPSVLKFTDEEELIKALVSESPVSYEIWKGDRLRLTLVLGKEK